MNWSFRSIFLTCLTAILLTLALIYRGLITYGLEQLYGQLNIIYNSVPIDVALNDSVLTMEQKRKLEMISEVRKFAISELELEDNGNYSTVFDQKGKPVLWIVTGCEPFSMKEYTWNFPVIGTVPYKGFFDHNKALGEQAIISEKGFDTDLSTVSAWSTLGFFSDPVLTGMLKRSSGSLAELIIHEMTHATVYVSSDTELNENLATFIGEKGAMAYLEWKFGPESPELAEYTGRQADSRTYGNYMVDAVGKLDSLYSTFSSEQSTEDKAIRKYGMIASLMMESNDIELNYPDRYRFRPGDMDLPNNTYFMSYKRYRDRLSSFQSELESEFSSELISFIRHYKEKYH